MNFQGFLKRLLGRGPFTAWARVSGESARKDASLLALNVQIAARAIAAFGDASIIRPPSQQIANENQQDNPSALKIGLFGNIANNHYANVKGLRHVGIDAELVIQEEGIDSHPLASPFWEDLEIECNSFEDARAYRSQWACPEFVRKVSWSEERQAQYHGRIEAVEEVNALYFDYFGRRLPDDLALLLAHNMGHWDLLLEMKRYDIVMLSSAAMALGPFAPCPFVVYPTGGDLFMSPFDETSLEGMLIRAAYARCQRIFLGGPVWATYLRRLGVFDKDVRVHQLLDTTVYRPGEELSLRAKWKSEVGGSLFILCVCRQDWHWKGVDKAITAFSKMNNPEARLVLSEWGEDLEKSKALINALGIKNLVLWLPIGSKPIVRARQRAADIIIDQLVMASFGSSVIESLAAGKPVVMNTEEPHSDTAGLERPPLLHAFSISEVVTVLNELRDDQYRAQAGAKSRDWAVRCRGFDKRANFFGEKLIEVANLC